MGDRPHHIRSIKRSVAVTALFLMSVIMANTGFLYAQSTTQSTTQSPAQASLSGTLHMYLVTLYGDSLQEIDHYRKTHKEGECIAFILKTDKPVDMTSYLSQEEIEFLSDNGSTWQSEFMVVPDWEKYESFSEKDFAEQYAHKSVRVTGSLFCPMAGWQNATLVRVDFTKVELVDSTQGNENKNAEESSAPTKYFFTFDDDSPERQAYAKELISFAERLQHDESTFDADLSAKLDELGIALLTSPDGKVKLYSWHDGDFGDAMSFHTIYQTKCNGEFHAVFMEDYYQEPRKLIQLESSAGPVYLVNFYFREGGWGFAGVNAFTMDKTGLLQPADVFECIPELHDTAAGYSSTLAADCSPETSSYWQDGAWLDNLFFDLTGKDFYMPHFFKRDETHRWGIMSDFYHRFTWDGEKFRYKQLEFNPVLTKYLPEPGWLMAEIETGDSLVRVDSVANGSYRLLLWNKDKMFSAAPKLIISQGQYDAKKQEYRFRKEDDEYVVNTVSQQLQIFYTEPRTKKVEGMRSHGANDY